jgi:hypothetical protein
MTLRSRDTPALADMTDVNSLRKLAITTLELLSR